jgi:hypothetical protein
MDVLGTRALVLELHISALEPFQPLPPQDRVATDGSDGGHAGFGHSL